MTSDKEDQDNEDFSEYRRSLRTYIGGDNLITSASIPRTNSHVINQPRRTI